MTELVRIEVIGFGGANVPQAHPGFIALAKDRGWRLVADYNFEWHDEETGETYGGFWTVSLHHDEPRGDVFWHYGLDVPEQIYARDHEPGWEAILKLADMSWQVFCEEQTYKDAQLLERSTTRDEWEAWWRWMRLANRGASA